MKSGKNKKLNIDIKHISENINTLKTPEVLDFVASQVRRENLGRLDQEWWIDFFVGVSLWGVAAGVIRVSD